MADEYTLGDVVRLLDGLAKSTDASLTEIKTEMRTGFAALTAEVRIGFDRAERRLGHIESRVEDVEGRVTALEARP